MAAKRLVGVALASLLSGSICTPKPERSDVDSDYAGGDEKAVPEGDRVGSGFW